MSSSMTQMFDRARIPLDISPDPLHLVNRDIFQLDVPREPAERVRIWAGAGDNEAEVLSIDETLRQLVLLLREPRRLYQDRVRIRSGRVTREQIEAFVREGGGGRVLHPRGSSWIVERYTEPAERRFLLGYDQRHLFAAQIPVGDTVREAHEVLMPAQVRDAERRRPGTTVRQGEWFFVPISPREESDLRQHLALDPYAARRRGRLPGGAEPHWVEQLVSIPGVVDPENGQRRLHLFARGTVHHRDHRTLSFDRWRCVHLNAAVRRRGELASGFYWVD